MVDVGFERGAASLTVRRSNVTRPHIREKTMKTKHATTEAFNSDRDRKNEDQDMDFAFVIELDPSQMMQVSGGIKLNYGGDGFDRVKLKAS